MMEKIFVKSSTHTYPIIINTDIRKRLATYFQKDYSKVFVITDEQVAELYLKDVLQSLSNYQVIHSVVPSGERSKSIEVYFQLQTTAIEGGLDRKSLIIALGGGVVGDLAGFVAATFMRGIDYIHVPTTILAHDSSVGGKVAINHHLGKNLIGSFYPPRAVLYDLATLKTLPISEVRSGYAEIIKEALIANKELFDELINVDLQQLSTDDLACHIYQGIQIKKAIVERDEKESFERMYLNLGHTLGHALEIAQKMLHGEAVAIGLLFSLFISEQLFDVNLPINDLYKWLNKNNYPLHIDASSKQEILHLILQDKKGTKGKIYFVLLKDLADPQVHSLKEIEVEQFLERFIPLLNGGTL